MREVYQERANRLAKFHFGQGFYDLSEEDQDHIYNKAMTQVDEELILQVEMVGRED